MNYCFKQYLSQPGTITDGYNIKPRMIMILMKLSQYHNMDAR